MPNRSLRLIVCLPVVIVFCFGGCSSSEDNPSDGQTNSPSGSKPFTGEGDSSAEDRVPWPEYTTGLCRIYGGDPQSLVLIDGQPARDADGNILSPPCEVRVAQGSCTITLTREDFQDFSRVVTISESSEVDFPPLQAATEFSVTTASAPLFELQPGTPYRFETLNSRGAELDPWLSPDGLTLWFVGDRSDGKAIYRATRASIWHEFTEPESLVLSRGPYLPASPSVTSDDLTVYFTAPQAARIYKLSRPDTFDRFANKEVVLKADEESAVWSSSSVLPDDLRLYWTEVSGEKVRGFAAVRNSLDEKFSRPIDYPLPGLVPMLSSDGLRQYSFDGQSLYRSRRDSLSDTFTHPKEIHKLALSDFVSQPNRRQVFVSENEQWMIYSLGDLSTADLWIVRLSRDAGWGVVPTGQRISSRTPIVMNVPDRKDSLSPEKKIDPRTVPLPIADYREPWLRHVANREYDAAKKLTAAGLRDSKLDASQSVLQMDQKILQSLEQFWVQAEHTFENLEEGRSLALGSARATFQNYKDGIVVMVAGGKMIERSLRELPATTLSTIVESSLSKEDAIARGQLAHFMLFDEEGRGSSAFSRVKEYPEQHRELLTHATEANLHLAQLELDRDNLLAGFRLLQQVMQQHPDSAASEKAKQLERKLYESTKWQMSGSRRWKTGEGGEYRAERERVENSFLRSPTSYRNFVLQFEWMTFDTLGQGGVFFNYPGQGRVYNNAFKIHLANDHLATPDAYSTGALFGMVEPLENTIKPSGEWNQCRIVMQEGDLQVFMNEQKVLDTIAISDEIPEEGFILFDGITGGISYRHILLMEAP